MRHRGGLLLVAFLAAAPVGGAVPARAAVLEVTGCGDTPAILPPPGELRTVLAGARDGDVVLIPPCTITLTLGALTLGKGVTLQGSGAERTILAGNGDRVLRVVAGTCSPNVEIRDLTIRQGTTGGDGGGILADGFVGARCTPVVLRRAVVRDSHATRGGGIAALGGPVTLDRSTVSGNTAGPGGSGGGLYVEAGVFLEEAALSGNTAQGPGGEGGGLFLLGGPFVGFAWLRQSTVSGNVAQGPVGGGAAIFNQGGTLLVHQSTVASNTIVAGGQGGGLHDSVGTAVLRGSIVSGNAPAGCSGPLGPGASAGHNLQDDASCPFGQATDQSGVDPLLGPLAPNGGLTLTHLPAAGSPALDRGGVAGCPGLDQRGVARPRDGDGDGVAACDVGAVERRPAGPGKLALPKVLDRLVDPK